MVGETSENEHALTFRHPCRAVGVNYTGGSVKKEPPALVLILLNARICATIYFHVQQLCLMLLWQIGCPPIALPILR